MKKKIQVDVGIRDLVDTLNQIKGVRTHACCDGHGVRNAWVATEGGAMDMTEVISRLALKQPGIVVTLNGGRGISQISLHPTLAGKSLDTMQHDLRKELEARGLLTEENPFEFGEVAEIIQSLAEEKGERAITWPPVADFSLSRTQMTAEKFERLKFFAYNQGIAYLKDFSDPVLNAHQEHLVGNKSRIFKHQEIISGTVCAGRFWYQIDCRGTEPKMVYIWYACWEARRLLVWLRMRRIVDGEYTTIELVTQDDLEGISFVNNQRVSESVSLVRELLA